MPNTNKKYNEKGVFIKETIGRVVAGGRRLFPLGYVFSRTSVALRFCPSVVAVFLVTFFLARKLKMAALSDKGCTVRLLKFEGPD